MIPMSRKRIRLPALLLALTAPAWPAFSQTRVAPVSATSLTGFGSAASVSASPFSVPAAALGAFAPTLAPAFAPSAAPSLSAPLAAPALSAAPAAAPSISLPSAIPAAAPALSAARGAAAAPSDGPKNDAAPSAEGAKSAADAAFDGASPAKPADEAAAVPGSESVGAPALAPASAHPAALIFDPGPRRASFPDRVRDRWRYNRLLTSSFWWYMYTHIKDMWPGYKSKWAKANAEGPIAVSRPRAFFAAMRVTGMSGRFYVLGGSALEDDLVIGEMRGAFRKYFDGPGIGAKEADALERFMARAKGFNAERRAHTNMYKNIRDPLIKASTMRPDQLAAFFDSLIPPAKEISTKEYQESGRMEATKEAFLKVLRETLDEENPNDPHRVRAAIVLGSFASGSAGPNSDFDVEALVNEASNERLGAFMKRLTDRWTAAGYHKTNPVTVHDNASWPSWGLVNIVQTRHYIVVSPEAPLAARLSRQAFENPATVLERGYTVRGRINRFLQWALVATATVVSDAKAAIGIKPSASSGH